MIITLYHIVAFDNTVTESSFDYVMSLGASILVMFWLLFPAGNALLWATTVAYLAARFAVMLINYVNSR